MKGITKILILLVFLVTLILNPPFLWGKPISIRVDAAKDLGPPPKILNSSIWIQNLGNLKGASYIIDKFLKDNKPSIVQLSLSILQNTKDFEDFKEILKTHFSMSSSLSFINKAKEYNTLVIVGYDPCPMPEWLSSNPGNLEKVSDWGGSVQSCSPPKDYKLWGEVVKYTLGYLSSLGLNNLGFYIGHEQERDWIGDEESFFEYYAETANAVKTVGNRIMVGGPGPSWITAKRNNCDTYLSKDIRLKCLEDGGWADPENEPFIKNFIEYVAKNNIPLDFINWHSFGVLPSGFQNSVTLINEWLRENKLEDVYLYVSDWTYWTFPPYPDDILDSQEPAAYIVNALYFMWKAGVDWHGHDFDVRDYGGREKGIKEIRNNSAFIGDWSIFSWGGGVGGGITKPMYNALKAISMVTQEDETGPRNLIKIEFTDENTIAAFATLTGSQRRISLILSNSIPSATMRFKKYLRYKIDRQTPFLDEEKKLIRKCIIESGRKESGDVVLPCINQLVSTLKDPQKIEALNFVAKAYAGLNNGKGLNDIRSVSKELKYPENKKIADSIMRILAARKNPTDVQIHFTNIPFEGKAKLTIYTIDGTHSNACSFNKRTEPTKTTVPCGIGGAVDCAVWDAKEKAQKGGIKTAEDYLLSLGYKENEVKYLKDIVKKCEKSGNIKLRLNKLLKDRDFKPTCSVKKLEEDLKETFKIYHKALHSFYYNAIDEINNWNEVSLEGSEVVNRIGIQNNSCTISLNMEPNSVALVILNKEPEK